MVLSCPTAIVAFFIVELNSTLYQDLPTDTSVIALENHELVVSGTYPQGSNINTGFNDVHILHVHGNPTYNPYFALNKQSRTLQNKKAIDTIQEKTSFIGTFLMAVNKQNQSQVNALYCVTYCIGNVTELPIHEACYDSISSGALDATVNGVLLSQHVYESNISRHASVAYNVLQLSLTSGNKSNLAFAVLECSSRLFFVDDRGVLRTGRELVEEDIAIHVLKIAVSANISDVPQVELALVTVKVREANTWPPIFGEPDGYTFTVKEGEQGLSVGFLKAVDSDMGVSGKVVYSFEKQQNTNLFELNDATGEIKTAVALDRETAETHLFTVIAADQGVPRPFRSRVEVRVVVEDINDNRPVFTRKEAELDLSLYTQPGPILSLKAEDKDTGENALMTYTISQGNDRNLFGINSTSGELLLVAPLTVTANDIIVLVVSVVDILSTNSSFQDTAVVKMTFRDVTYSGVGSSSVALVSGVSVGGVLFIAIIAVFSFWLWKRQKSQLNRRKYDAIPVINTDQTPFEYDRKIYTVRDTVGRSFEIYPPLMDTVRSPGISRDSQISLDLNTIEHALRPFSLVSKRPGLSHSAPPTPTKDLRRSRGSHVSLDQTEVRSQSLPTLSSHVRLDLGQVEPEFITETAKVSLKLGGMDHESQLISTFSSDDSRTSSSVVTAHGSLDHSEGESGSPLSWQSFSDDSRSSSGGSKGDIHLPRDATSFPPSIGSWGSAAIITETVHGSLELGEGEHKSPLLTQSSSEDSRTTSGGSKGDIDPPRDDASITPSIGSWGSAAIITETVRGSVELGEGEHKSPLLTQCSSEDSRTTSGGSKGDIHPPRDDASITASIGSWGSAAIITETVHGSLELGEGEHKSPLLSQSSSEDSRISSGGSKGDIDPPRDDASITPSIGSWGSAAIITETVRGSVELGEGEHKSPLLTQSSSEDSRTTSGGSKGDIDPPRDDASITPSIGSWGSAAIITETVHGSLELGEGEHKSPLLSQSSSEDSRISSGGSKGDIDPPRDDASITPSIGSWGSAAIITETVRGRVELGEGEHKSPLLTQCSSEDSRTTSGDSKGDIDPPRDDASITPSIGSWGSAAIVTETVRGSVELGEGEHKSPLLTQCSSEDSRTTSGGSKGDIHPPRDDASITASIGSWGSAAIITETVHGSLELGEGEHKSPLLSQSSSEDSRISSGCLKGDIDPPRDDASITPSIGSWGSAAIITETVRDSVELGEGEHKSPLLTQCSSEDSRTTSGDSKGDIDPPRDDASITPSIGSWRSLQTHRPQGFQSKLSIELETHQNINEQHFATDEDLADSNLRYAKPATLGVEARGQPHIEQISSLQLCKETPQETVSLPIVTGSKENVTPEGDRQRPIQNLNRSISFPSMAYSSTEGPDQTVRAEISSDVEVESSTLVSSAIQSDAKLQPVKTRKARVPVKVKQALKFMTPEKESKQYSKFQQEDSSEDSDDTTQEPNTSIPRKKFPLFGRKKKKSSSHRPTLGQRRDGLSQARTELGDLPFPFTQQENTSVITDQNAVEEQNLRLKSVSSEGLTEVNEPLKAGSFNLSSSQDSLVTMEASFSPTPPATIDVVRTVEDTRFTDHVICSSSFGTSNTESMLPTTSELASSESHDSVLLNVVGKDVFHVSQEQDIPHSTNETGPKDGSRSSLREDESPGTMILPLGNALITDSSTAMRESGVEMMFSEVVSERRDELGTSAIARSRVSLSSSPSLEADTTHQESLMQKSEDVLTASQKTQESVAISTETPHGSLKHFEGENESPLLLESSSEDSRTSSGGSKEDIDLPRDDASFASIETRWSLQTDRPQGFQRKLTNERETDQDSSEEYFSTDDLPRRKTVKSSKPDTLKLSAKDQQPHGVELLLPGSFEDDSSPLHRKSIEDPGKSQNTKAQPVKPKKARIPLKVKKALKFLTSETEHKLYSEFQQEGSSDDSEDREPKTFTSRRRFPLFGRKRKKSGSRGKTPRHDSLPQTESGVLTVPSTQQENAPVLADQRVVTDHFPCSTELETSEIRGADTWTEGSIGATSDNGEKLEKASAGLSKSGESVIRGEDATIESKGIEEFEREDNIELSTVCAEHSALVLNDSMNVIPETSCKTEDTEGFEGDLQEQSLGSESVNRESVGEVVEKIEAGSFTLSPDRVNLTSSATPSLRHVASFSTTLPAVTDVLRTTEQTDKTSLEDGSVPLSHEEEHSKTFTSPSDNAVTTDSLAATPRTVAERILSEDLSEPQDDFGKSTSGTLRVSSGSVHEEEFQSSHPAERCSKAGITLSSHVPSESSMTNLSHHSSQTSQQEHLPTDIKTELAPQAGPSSSPSDTSIRSSDSSSVVVVVSFCPREDEKPLRQSKPCVVLSDSDIQLCRESTSATLASNTSPVSHQSPSRGSILSLQSSEHKATVKRTAQSQTLDTDLSALHPPLDTSGAERLQQLSPAWSGRNSIEQLSLDATSDNAAEASSSGLLGPELSTPPAVRKETSHTGFGMLMSSFKNLLFSRERPHDDDTSSETDK